jgi:hypothetical protein
MLISCHLARCTHQQGPASPQPGKNLHAAPGRCPSRHPICSVPHCGGVLRGAVWCAAAGRSPDIRALLPCSRNDCARKATDPSPAVPVLSCALVRAKSVGCVSSVAATAETKPEVKLTSTCGRPSPASACKQMWPTSGQRKEGAWGRGEGKHLPGGFPQQVSGCAKVQRGPRLQGIRPRRGDAPRQLSPSLAACASCVE